MIKLFVFVGLLAIASAEPTGRLEGRIIGGHAIEIEQVPYQISLLQNDSHYCGGSIISEKFVLTAAHCVDEPATYSVRAGSKNQESGGSIHKAVNIETFNYTFYEIGIPINDLALIEISPPFEFSEKVATIPLYESKEEIKPETIALISGWGRTLTSNNPTNLEAVEVPMISKKECKEAYSDFGDFPEGQICTALPNGGKDACQGDSGGPVAINGELVGIVSWGIGCAIQGNPGVCTEVAYYADLIKQHMVL